MALFDFPRWKLTSPAAESGVVAPDERLSAGQTLVMGVQHAVAMFGATVLMPLLMGLDPNLSILMSGVGTLLFFVVTGGRVPSYLGSSAAFVGVVIAITGFNGQGLNPHLSVALGGIIACGLVYTPDWSGGDEDRHPLDRAPDAAGGDRRGGDGYRPEPGADCRAQRLRQRLRQLDGGVDRALHRHSGGIYPRDAAATADPGRPDRRLRAVRPAG